MFSPENIEKAHQLYLQGKRPGEVAAILTREFNMPCRASTVASWATKFGWKDELAAIQTLAIIPIAEQHRTIVATDVKRRLEFYGNVLDIIKAKINAAEELGIPLDIVDVDDFAKMVKAADIAAQGERKEQLGILTVQFVNDVLDVLLEEVRDEHLLQRIAVKLRRLALQYQQ